MESAGPTSFMTKQCKDGYHGYACTSCVRNSTHTFGKVGSLKCQLCRSPSLIVVTYIASTILVLMLLCYTILVTLQENTEARNTDEDGGDAAPKESVKVSELLRVCIPKTVHSLTHSLTHSLARLLAFLPARVHLCFPSLLTGTLACSHALMYSLAD